MKSFTEHELIRNQAKYLFRIKNLIKNKQIPISDIGECLNYNLHLNFRDSLKIDYLNEFGINKLGQPLTAIKMRGLELMGELIEPKSMADALKTIRKYGKQNDIKHYFTFYQNIRDRVETDYCWRSTTRCVLDENYFISITYSLQELEKMSLISSGVLEPNLVIENYLYQFQSLTKREKEILIMIGTGKTSRRISDLLSLSVHTINVHRKNIIKKLNIKNQAELFRFGMLIESI